MCTRQTEACGEKDRPRCSRGAIGHGLDSESNLRPHFLLRVEPGQRGIDVSVPEKHIARLGFAHAEIKPLSASGEKKLQQQIWKWGYDPSTVRAITYDADGNVYFGFR
jgi:hypothetical protein